MSYSSDSPIKVKAEQLIERHKEWIKRGFDDCIFSCWDLQPNAGGGILAHNTSFSGLQSRINDDPFVAENVVRAEIIELTPSKAVAPLEFLLGTAT